MSRIYAHRGASAELPENTLPAFARAVELSVYGLELDVHLSHDGIPVVIHDDSVDRTTNGSGTVAELTLDQLRALDAGAGATIPTLGEVLNLTGGALHVNIEVKTADAADAVLSEVSSRPALRFAISSFDHDVLRHIHTVSPEIELWPLTHVASDEVLETAVELDSTQINIDDAFVNREIVAYIRSRGIDCWVWTVNDVQRAKELAGYSVVGLCTDDPAALKTALGH